MDDAFAMGREAHDAGKTSDQNPFSLQKEESQYFEWMDGFQEAADESV